MSFLTRLTHRLAPHHGGAKSVLTRPKGLAPSLAREGQDEAGEETAQAQPVSAAPLRREATAPDTEETAQAKPHSSRLARQGEAEEEVSDSAQPLRRASSDRPSEDTPVQARHDSAILHRAADDKPAEDTPAQPLRRARADGEDEMAQPLRRQAEPEPEDTAQPLRTHPQPTYLARNIPAGPEEVTPETTPAPEARVGEEPSPEIQARHAAIAHRDMSAAIPPSVKSFTPMELSANPPAAHSSTPELSSNSDITPPAHSALSEPAPAMTGFDNVTEEAARPRETHETYTPFPAPTPFQDKSQEPASGPAQVTIEQVDVLIHEDSQPVSQASSPTPARQAQRFRAKFMGGL